MMIPAGFIATLITTTFLAVQTFPHGEPLLLPQAPSVHFTPMPVRVGVDMPVTLITATAQTMQSVRQHLRITPPVFISVYSRHNMRFVILPNPAWPAQRHIAVTWVPTRTSVRFSTDDDRSIGIDLTTQQLIAQRHGITIRTIAVSTGVAPKWTTPQGTYWIYKKVLDDHMVGGSAQSPDHWDVQHVPYAQYFTGAVAIHGAWWNHHFGRPASHGCVQVPTAEGPDGPTGEPAEAQWLWHFADLGTPVMVYGQTPTTDRTRMSMPQASRP
ncbi:MAG: hypothetical protein C7B45_06790 [Sulfobacillus acidophilus]|uniref:L,D-TPase catalytic domain-containing protein n=1 Tax=Sulfobacillus acidophilus TaxID=53633 RepID=A0A2T2WJK0_9FIRM|nr:MAG: hypothetical protein C7B45_06790 [Sulfobacillus acidophilus]